jgi:hypothetical protein
MPPTLDDAWAKVEWAHGQLIRLDELLKPFLDSNPYLVRDEINAEGTERIIWAESPQPPPAQITFIFGDLVHALHSALDYVVCSLVESVGREPTTKHAFPIFGLRSAYEAKAPDTLHHVPYEAVKFIESVQPYHDLERATEQGKTPEEVAAEAEFMPLMRLYRLSIEEKHRALLLATSVMDVEGTYVGHNRVGEQASGIGFRVSRAHDKVEIVIPVDPTNPDEQFSKGFGAKVSLVKEGPWGVEIESLARMLYNEVAHRVLPGIRWLNLIPLTRPRDLPYVWQ